MQKHLDRAETFTSVLNGPSSIISAINKLVKLDKLSLIGFFFKFVHMNISHCMPLKMHTLTPI